VELSGKKRKYIRRHAAEESPEEIAKALKIPKKAVERFLAKEGGHSARGKLPTWLERLLDGGSFWSLFAIAVAAPFVLLKGNYDKANLPQSAFIQVGVLTVLLAWLLRSAVRGELRIQRTALGLPVLCFLGWALLSLIWARNGHEAFITWTHWAACGIAFFVAVNVIPDDRRARILLAGIFVSGGLVAATEILQYLVGDSFAWMPRIPQAVPPAATFMNKNCAVQYVILALPLGAFLLVTSRSPLWDWLSVLGSATMLLFVFYAFSRGGWVALSLQVVAFGAMLSWDRFRLGNRLALVTWKSKVAAVASCAVLLLVLVNLTPEGFNWRGGKALEHASLIWRGPKEAGGGDSPAEEDAVDDGSANGAETDVHYRISKGLRLNVWQNTLEMVKDHPVVGVGIGNWLVHYPRYSSSVVVDRFVTSKMQVKRVHNDLLQNLAELGLVGTALFAWLGIAVFMACARLAGRGSAPETRYAAMSMAAGLTGLLVIACFSFPFRRAVPPFTIMVFLGVLGASLVGYGRGGAAGGALRLPRQVPVVAAGLVLLLMLVHARTHYRRLVADRHFLKMKLARREGDWDGVVTEGRKVHAYDPGRKQALVHMARAHVKLGRPKKAIPLLEEVVDAWPNHLNAHNALGVAHMMVGDFDKAAVHYRRAIEIKPQYHEGHNNLGDLHMRQKRIDEALRSFERALEGDPKNIMYLKNAGLAHAAKGEYDEALGHYARALELKPGLADVHFLTGEVHFKRGEHARALESHRLAAQHAPDNAAYHHKAGCAAFHAGRPREARKLLERALELRPDWDVAHRDLGVVLYNALGEKDEGLRHLKRALELNPDMAEAEEIRRAIENSEVQR
jgi:tetratricopeptide (TPR) repeat protein